MATITITGVEELNRKLDRAQRNKILVGPMGRAMDRLERDMKEYPPEPPASTYDRTDRLKNSWTRKVNKSARGLLGRVGNNTKYGPFVQSERFQAWMHKGRWQTDQDVVNKNQRAIVRDFERAIEKALK